MSGESIGWVEAARAARAGCAGEELCGLAKFKFQDSRVSKQSVPGQSIVLKLLDSR